MDENEIVQDTLGHEEEKVEYTEDVEETAQNQVNEEEAVHDSWNEEETAQSRTMNEEEVVNSPWNEEETVHHPANEETAQSPVNEEEAVQNPWNEEEEIQNPMNDEEAAEAPVNEEKPMSVPWNGEETVVNVDNEEERLQSEVNKEESVGLLNVENLEHLDIDALNDELEKDYDPLVSIRDCKKIPEGFPDLLELLCREVLRSQPPSIVQYIADTLNKLVGLRDGKRESGKDINPMELPIPETLLSNTT